MVKSFQASGIKTTAEGIETKDMAEALTGIGCDILQGYYFSRPLPEQDFLAYMQNQPQSFQKKRRSAGSFESADRLFGKGSCVHDPFQKR